MRESEIKRQCKDKLQEWGWMVVHLIQTNVNGIPDTLCLRGGRAVFIEFKRPGLSPRELQEYRIRKLREHGFEALTVRSISDIAHLQNP